VTCWFCGTKEAESKKSIHLFMYGEVQASDTEENKKRITYSTKKVDVPRCADCKKSHTQAGIANVFIIIMAVFLLASVLCAVAAVWVQPWLWGLVMGLATAFIIMLFVLKIFILRGIKKVSAAKREYPQVVDLMVEGYKFGKNPSYEESVTNGTTAVAVEPKNTDMEEKE
jgi:Flp pilus assembly protein TadB